MRRVLEDDGWIRSRRSLWATFPARDAVTRILPSLILPLILVSGIGTSFASGETNGIEAQRLEAAIAEYQRAMETEDPNARQENFRRAQLLFRQMVDETPSPGAALLTNLGNAALQAEQLGPAIAAYRRALEVDPQYRRAKSNLAFARSMLPAWARHQPNGNVFNSLFFWKEFIRPATINLLAAAAFLLTASLWAVATGWQQPLLKNLALVPALVWLVLLGSQCLERYADHQLQGVVIAEEVVARSADSVTAAPRLSAPLPAGTEVSILEDREGWMFVQIANQQSAWIPASSVELVPP